MIFPAAYEMEADAPLWRLILAAPLLPLILVSLLILSVAYVFAWSVYQVAKWIDGRKGLLSFWEWLNIIR